MRTFIIAAIVILLVSCVKQEGIEYPQERDIQGWLHNPNPDSSTYFIVYVNPRNYKNLTKVELINNKTGYKASISPLTVAAALVNDTTNFYRLHGNEYTFKVYKDQTVTDTLAVKIP